MWEQVRDQGYRPTDWQIKRLLTEDRIPAGAALARFVGVDAYEAAGGPVLRDLFADEHENGVWLEDPALLMKLAMDRLQTAADELATRWKWAEPRLDVDWSDLARFGRVRPAPAQPTDEEQAEIERLHSRHDELVNMDEDDWTDELIEEAEAIEPRLAEIQDAVKARAVFSPDQTAVAGCIVTVGGDGALQVVHGLVKPEDIPEDEPAASFPLANGWKLTRRRLTVHARRLTPSLRDPGRPVLPVRRLPAAFRPVPPLVLPRSTHPDRAPRPRRPARFREPESGRDGATRPGGRERFPVRGTCLREEQTHDTARLCRHRIARHAVRRPP